MIGYDSIEYASLTDVGIRRSHNQDAHATLLASDAEQWKERGHVFLVADGMGAHAVGELASELAVQIIPHTYHKYAPQTGVPALRKAFVEANASIHAKGQQNPEFGGMGTTTTALLLKPEGAWIGHVGDSRVYRIRSGLIEQMSFDHSLVWEMARRQGVDPETLEGIPSNVIVRSLGPEALVQVDVEGPHPLRPGDYYLLCSDGLSGQLSDSEIGCIVENMPPAEACRFLVDLANLRGGPDNITALVVHLNEPSGPQTEEETKKGSAIPRMSWPVGFVMIGLLFAGGAAVLRSHDFLNAGMAFLGAAAAAIVVGVIGLLVSLTKERRKISEESNSPRPKIYRQASCSLEQPTVDRLFKAMPALEKAVKDRDWDADWNAYRRKRDESERLAAEGQLADSFCEGCRALSILAEAAQRQRVKGEVFPVIWEKRR